MMPVVILAGGLATRLYPKTLQVPKSLIEINGLPFIHHQLTLLKERGVTEVILCVGHFGKMIEEYVGDGSRFGLNVRYSYDGEFLLGTGGAIKKATEFLPDIFMIQYGDSYLDVDFEPILKRFYNEDLPVLMTAYHNRNDHDTSNIILKDGRILKYNKKDRDPAMEYIDYGLIIIRKMIFDAYPSNIAFDLSSVLSQSVDAGQVASYEVKQRFFEIGSVEGIKETGDYIRNRRLHS
jgi:N-acetyl-alpha-D-muramate 1-phosphate uridylyltransferase